MKHLILLLAIVATTHLCLPLQMSAINIRQPDYIGICAEGLTLLSVEDGDSTTHLHFCYEGKPGTQLTISSAAFLSDEQDRRYPLVSAVGIATDKSVSVDTTGRHCFMLSFTRLPEGTQTFDFIESINGLGAWQLFQIQEKGTPLRWKSRNSEKGVPLTPTMMRRDTVHLSGRFVNSRFDRLHTRYGMSPLSANPMQNRLDNCRMSPTALYIESDSTFSGTYVVNGPRWTTLQLGRYDIPVLLIPGDHPYVEIHDLGQCSQRVDYRSDVATYGNLMNVPALSTLSESWWRQHNDTWWQGQIDSISMEEVTTETNRIEELVDYVSWKYQLDESERQLLSTEMEMFRAFRYSRYWERIYKLSQAQMPEWNQPHTAAEINGTQCVSRAVLARYGMEPDFTYLSAIPAGDVAAWAVPSVPFTCESLVSVSNRMAVENMTNLSLPEGPESFPEAYFLLDSLKLRQFADRMQPSGDTSVNYLLEMLTLNLMKRSTPYGISLRKDFKNRPSMADTPVRYRNLLRLPLSRQLAAERIAVSDSPDIFSVRLNESRGHRLAARLLDADSGRYTVMFLLTPSDSVWLDSASQVYDQYRDNPNLRFQVYYPAEYWTQEQLDTARARNSLMAAAQPIGLENYLLLRSEFGDGRGTGIQFDWWGNRPLWPELFFTDSEVFARELSRLLLVKSALYQDGDVMRILQWPQWGIH